tara:strand:+ start:78 stop:416 length:339 start_codon:yes stop_codon:yes gene_type:complete
MISYTSVLTREDWKNLHGNEVFVTMLRNKVKVEIEKDKKVAINSDDYRKSGDDSLLSIVLDYIKTVPEDLVYIDIEDVFGNKTIYVYFASAIDKENFYHYYNMQSGIEEIRK